MSLFLLYLLTPFSLILSKIHKQNKETVKKDMQYGLINWGFNDQAILEFIKGMLRI
jgi:hypothetical protein